jgi:hypothetical protein
MVSSGQSSGAAERASSARGIRVATLTLAELRAWAPKGTISWRLRINPSREAAATNALREVGFRVVRGESDSGDEVELVVLRHHGRPNRLPMSKNKIEWRSRGH